jgi:glutathione S-transferase
VTDAALLELNDWLAPRTFLCGHLATLADYCMYAALSTDVVRDLPQIEWDNSLASGPAVTMVYVGIAHGCNILMHCSALCIATTLLSVT